MDTEKIKSIISNHESKGQYKTIDGVKTFVLDQGQGEVVFCIHGVPTSSFLFRKVADHLSTVGMRAVAIDLPGLGLSERPENFNYIFSNFAAFCEKLLIEMNIESFHLLIHDIGTPIGLALANKVPDKVKSITILNSMLDIKNFIKPLPMRPFEKPVLGEAELAMLTRTTWPVMMKFAGVEDIDKIPKEEIAAYIDLLKREDDGKAFLKIMRNFEQTEAFNNKCYSGLQNRNYPVQLIWGVNDLFLPYEEHGIQFTKARPDAVVFKLKSKHFSAEEFPEFIGDKIKELKDHALH